MPSTYTVTVNLPANAAQWTVIDGLPGAWRRLRTRVALSATAQDGVLVDGRLVDGLQLLRPASDGVPSTITVSGTPVRLVDDGVEVLRLLPTSRCA